MNQKDFFCIVSKNISFENKEEKKKFYEYYNELISEMLLSGKTEDEIFQSLNINLIIEQYNETKHKDYIIYMKNKEFKKDVRIFNYSIIFGLLVPTLFLLLITIINFIRKDTIDFWNHSVRLAMSIIFLLFYETYFRINEIYFIVKKMKNEYSKKSSCLFLFIIFWILSSVLEVFILFLFINEKFLIVLFITLLLFVPYIFFIVKKRRMNCENYY